MKKLYTLMLATAMSATAFAQTPVDGSWEFTVVDITESVANFTPTTVKVTAVSEGNDIYWNFDGTTYGIYSFFDSSTNNCRFQNYDYEGSTTRGVVDGQYLYQKTFYVDGSDLSYNMLYADFDADKGILTNFTRKGVFNPMPTEVLGFDLIYSDRWRNQENGTFYRFYIVSAKKVESEQNEGFIKIDLYDDGTYPRITKYGQGYYLSERLDVTAVGYDSFTVYYTITEKDGAVFKQSQKADALGGKTYSIDVFGVPANKEFILSCWAESGDYKSEEATLEFNTLEEPEVVEGSLEVSLPYADYGYPFTGYVPGNPEKAYAWDFVEVIAEGIDDFNVYYSISANGQEVVSKTEAPYEEDYEMYVVLDKTLDYGVDYTLTVWAEGGNVKSNEATSQFTIEKTEVIVTGVEVSDITSKSATLTVEFECVGLPYAMYFPTEITVKDGEEVIDTQYAYAGDEVEIDLTDLEAGKQYNLTVTATYSEEDLVFYSDEVTTFVSEPYEVTFTTEGVKAIIIEEHSHEGATFKVTRISKVGLEEEDEIDIYFGLKGSYMAHEKATYNPADGSYEYTFENVYPKQDYTALIYGGKGEEGDQDYFRDTDNMIEVPFTVDSSSVDSIEADSNSDVRYFNLQGVEVKNPVPGASYIKVVKGAASKVLVK